MKLNDAEQAMLNGDKGKAKQKAMDLLVRYGEALGAERLVDVKNVASTFNAGSPAMKPYAEKGMDAVFSKFNLDSDEVVETPQMEVYTCQLIHGIDTQNAHVTGVAEEAVNRQKQAERYFGERGVAMFNTCTPYQVGNVPVRGEHCAWMESSAVVYCNGVLGARTNTEGRESTGAAAITGKIPYWGYHIPENRLGTHLVDVEVDVDDMMDWGLLGYAVGEIVEEDIPVLSGIRKVPSMIKLKHFGAAAASSGGVEMYHIPGVTPEADTVEEAFGTKKPLERIKYGQRSASSPTTISILRRRAPTSISSCLAARTIRSNRCGRLRSSWTARSSQPNTQLWVFTPRALRDTAELNGYGDMIRKAGAHLMSDTCPAIGRVMPKGTGVVATDSAKQAHYLPAIMKCQTWFGTVEDCVNAALTGRWQGGLQ
jgi:predicted aconitase